MAADSMTFTRRRMLGSTAALAAATGVLGGPAVRALAAPTPAPDEHCPPEGLLPPARIGLHAYTIRDQIAQLGWGGVFERAADIGYESVTFSAGYRRAEGRTVPAAQLRELLDANGLHAVAAHTAATTPDALRPELEDAATVGLRYVGLSSAPASAGTVAAWQSVAEQLNRLGAAAREHGISFYLHNHQQEFAPATDDPGQRAYDILLRHTDPALVCFQLDIYWAHVGQHLFGRAPLPTFDPLDYVTAAPERFPLFHVKDGRRNASNPMGYDIADVGSGDLDLQGFFTAIADRLEHHWFHNEQDNAGSAPRGSWGSARRSYLWMRHGLTPPAAAPEHPVAARPVGRLPR